MQFSLCSKPRASRLAICGAATLSACAFLVATAGCASYPVETGFADPGKIQLQFFAPPGASVTVAGSPTRTHEVSDYGQAGHRLEHSPEEFAVFNLSPGRYEFKYVAAEGLSDVSVYGELEVQSPCNCSAKEFIRRSFIPISLPSAYYKKVSDKGDEVFPYRGQTVKTAIDETDLMRLKQGDMVEKVFVLADLHKADRMVRENRRRLVVLDRELEYAEGRFRDAYSNWRLASDDLGSRIWGEDREFIQWEKKRLELKDRIAETQAELKRAEALLAGDHVLVRDRMLAVATEETVKPYKKITRAADDIGEIVLIMRIGGRHHQWGERPREAVQFTP